MTCNPYRLSEYRCVRVPWEGSFAADALLVQTKSEDLALTTSRHTSWSLSSLCPPRRRADHLRWAEYLPLFAALLTAD